MFAKGVNRELKIYHRKRKLVGFMSFCTNKNDGIQLTPIFSQKGISIRRLDDAHYQKRNQKVC
jgi:hypothetical protein